MNKVLDTLCYIQEQTSFLEDYGDNEFGYQIHGDPATNRFFVTFPAVLQSFGIKNRNRREYSASNIWHCIESDEQIQTMLKNNSWIGEIDHPSADKTGESLTMQRIANPDMERSSHFIRSPHLNGNLLEANIQTDSSTDAGMNMAKKIVDGKMVPCFSARVLGALENIGGKPIVNVRKLITYDWVLYPSHIEAEAKINQPIQESAEIANFEEYANCKIIRFPELAKMAAGDEDVKILCEAFELTEDDIIGVTKTGNSAVFQESGNIYVQPINDRNIRKRTQDAINDWLND